ncbi:MAG: Flp pilus assembly complex ATPase component TadA [Thermoplasmata archaeon]|nr:Flp pilus assembly complex ATPase component TadA [Thermoplasmata archaeon]
MTAGAGDNMEVLKRDENVTIYRRGEKRAHIYALSDAAVQAAPAAGPGAASLAPIGPFLADDGLEEIMYNGGGMVRVFHRRYGMCDTNVTITPDDVVRMLEYIANFNNDEISTDKPMLDGRLPDGSRVNGTLPPATPDGPTMTIRKFMKKPMTITQLLDNGTLDPSTAAFLWVAVEGLGAKAANILVSGGTGSGKTTTLNVLSTFIPIVSRVVTIEDTAELQLAHENWIRLETVVGGPRGADITMDHLLKNALRMRPDRIIVGEVRGPEATTMFTAMNTGHDGTLGTLHANTAIETITRITNPPMSVPPVQLGALDLIVMQNKITMPSKTVRRVTEISEVSGMEGGKPSINTLFRYTSESGLRPTGVPSKLREVIARSAGIPIAELDAVISNRRDVLQYLVENEIKDQREVIRIVQDYNYL